MNKQSSLASRVLGVVLGLGLVGAVAPPARAGDKEFGRLVHYVESHYHRHRSHRILLGLACFAVNVAARPEGVRGMKLALWEGGSWPATSGADADFPDVVRAGLEEGWLPMVRIWSRRSGERTVIFAKPEGSELKLLVATVEDSEAIVVQMIINPDRLSKCLDEWTDRKTRHRGTDPFVPPRDDTPTQYTSADAM